MMLIFLCACGDNPSIVCLHCVYRMLFHAFLEKPEPEQLKWNHAGLCISCLRSHFVLQVEIWFTEMQLWNSKMYSERSFRVMWGCASAQWENTITSFTFWSPATSDPRTWNRLRDVMMSQCLWHHMGLVTEKGKGVERGVKLAGEAVWVFFFSELNRTEPCVCSGQTGSCEWVCVCVCFPVEEPPWFHKHGRGIHSSRKTTASLTARAAHTLIHTLIHTHTHALNPISSSLISWLDWSCGAALFAEREVIISI